MARNKVSFTDAVLNPNTKGLQLENQITPAVILDAATVTPPTSLPNETPQTDVSEVPTVKAEIEEAAEKFIFAPLKKGATFPDALDFSKFVFNLLGVPLDLGGTEDKALSKNALYCEAYNIIKETHEKRTDKTVSTWAFIDQHYHKMISPEKFKGSSSSEKTAIKAKSEKPTYTVKQLATLETVIEMFGVDSDMYIQAKTKIDAELKERVDAWVKETAENDRKSKSVFVKNFIRQSNDIGFLNSLFDLCKEQEQKQATEEDDNQPF